MGAAERVLILVSTTSYRTDDFVAAARRLGVAPVVGNDRCHELAKLWPDASFGTLQVELRDPDHAVAQIVAAAAAAPFAAILGTDEPTTHIAALAARALSLPGNDPAAAYRTRNKMQMRRALQEGGVPSPRATTYDIDSDPLPIARSHLLPVVLKPLLLSTSRGVIRANDLDGFVAAWLRIRALLDQPAHRAVTDPASRHILVENYLPGVEVAVEGVLTSGGLDVLALFDKPDPLEGPYFEETIYVTPSRHPEATQIAIAQVTAAAARAIGLTTGPVHAELRLTSAGPSVLEIAARTIGGLCARTLRFGMDGRSLEEVVLAHALGAKVPLLDGRRASGVMMIPVPGAGVFQEVRGVDQAKSIEGVEDVVITTRVGEVLVPLPEGASYFGFIFARGDAPEDVEASLRAAHAKLTFRVAPTL